MEQERWEVSDGVKDIGSLRIRVEEVKAVVKAAMVLQGREDGKREMCVTICFPQKVEPETRI